MRVNFRRAAAPCRACPPAKWSSVARLPAPATWICMACQSARCSQTGPNGDTISVQWFERARFELHGGNEIFLGLLGREKRAEGSQPTPSPAPAPCSRRRSQSPSRRRWLRAHPGAVSQPTLPCPMFRCQFAGIHAVSPCPRRQGRQSPRPRICALST